MRYHLTATLFCSLVFSGSSFAVSLNSDVDQTVIVRNKSSQGVLVTDSTSSTVYDLLLLSPKYGNGYYTFSDQFTILPEQTFSHTLTILSAEGNKPICTVTTHLTVGLTSFNAEEPTSSDPAKCEAVTESSSASFSKESSGVNYRYSITVK
ncbi:MAG: hypothetical protein K0S63_653 [Gammaproteobacteria bacterium]|jgi:hypothetical protein|nr:hypothetical protein [Gammaproteobacteria bacterium]